VSDPVFIKVTLTSGSPAWVNLANVAFVSQSGNSPTQIRFLGTPENQVGIKESLQEVESSLPGRLSDPTHQPRSRLAPNQSSM